jgi:hypothetical protein
MSKCSIGYHLRTVLYRLESILNPLVQKGTRYHPVPLLLPVTRLNYIRFNPALTLLGDITDVSIAVEFDASLDTVEFLRGKPPSEATLLEDG